MSVKIVVDSGGDIPPELVSRYDLEVVPLKIRFGDQEFLDGKELSVDRFWEMCESSPELPQTSAPSSGDFQSAFERAAHAGHDQVVCITLSSNLSATHQSAMIAADSFGNDLAIEVIDSRLATFAMGNLAIIAAKEAAAGYGAAEIATRIRELIPTVRAFGALDTLEYLRKGGRIGKAAAVFGSMLSFKPIIDVRNGVVEPDSKQRTRSKAMAYLLEKARSLGPVTDVAVIHANAPDVDEFAAELRKVTGTLDLVVAKIGPVIGTHAGPRTIGITLRTLDGSTGL